MPTKLADAKKATGSQQLAQPTSVNHNKPLKKIIISRETVGKSLGSKVNKEDWQQYTEEVDIVAVIAEHMVGYLEHQYDTHMK